MAEFSLPDLRSLLKRAIEPAHSYSAQIDRALTLAFNSHAGQFRDQRNVEAPKIPYVVHPVGVATTAVTLLRYADLRDSFDDIVSGCLTHDVLEDSDVPLSELERATSARTANIVLSLTKPPVKATKSRADRNAAFLQQIVNGGPTPCFIKVCDAIHNLSRPRSMPRDLLGKTIKKATTDYLKLADDPHFRPEVREALESRIREAEKLYSFREDIQEAMEFSSFEQAVAYGLKRSKSKVLEEHDIAALVETTTNARHCFVGSFDEYARLHLEELRADHSEQAYKTVQGQLNSGKLDLATRIFDRSKVRESGISQIICCPFGAESVDEPRFLFVAVSDSLVPGWLTPVTLLGFVSILSERLRDHEARQLSKIAEEISLLGLSLDPGVAYREKLTYEHLVSLKARVEAAEFVHRNLLSSIQRLAAEAGLTNYIDRIEGRVKSMSSIVEKMRIRKIRDIDQIDDLVGVRIVVASKAVRERLSDLLLSEMRSETSEFGRMVPIVKPSVDIEAIKSSVGYTAVHARFRVKAPTVLFESVRCEVQMRTVFEDAWARVSHMTTYKRELDGKKVKAILDELAKHRDACEELILQLR